MTAGKIHVGLDAIPERTDVLVIGLGITGAGVALDAATRGLDVVAVDAEDVAFGTSRWSSKLVHGGLRYLAKGQRHESIREGDADVLARSLLLACHGFVLSAHTMTDSDAGTPHRDADVSAFDRELGHLVQRFLQP